MLRRSRCVQIFLLNKVFCVTNTEYQYKVDSSSVHRRSHPRNLRECAILTTVVRLQQKSQVLQLRLEKCLMFLDEGGGGEGVASRVVEQVHPPGQIWRLSGETKHFKVR